MSFVGFNCGHNLPAAPWSPGSENCSLKESGGNRLSGGGEPTFLISGLRPFHHPPARQPRDPAQLLKTLPLSISFERILKNCSVSSPKSSACLFLSLMISFETQKYLIFDESRLPAVSVPRAVHFARCHLRLLCQHRASQTVSCAFFQMLYSFRVGPSF